MGSCGYVILCMLCLCIFFACHVSGNRLQFEADDVEVFGAPSSFKDLEKIGEGSYAKVFKATQFGGHGSGTSYALKQLGPVANVWDSGYSSAELIHRELRALVALRDQANRRGEHEAEHSVAFYGCFRSHVNITWLPTFLQVYCIPDIGVKPGFFWLQLGQEGASLLSYLKDSEWRRSLLAGLANSPLPAVTLDSYSPDQLQHLKRLTKGKLFGNGWQDCKCYIGADGGFYIEKPASTFPNKPQLKIELAAINISSIGDAARCAHNPSWSCFNVAGNVLSADKVTTAESWVLALRKNCAHLQTAQRSLPLLELRHMIREMLLGLFDLSKAGIIHGDIKPDNLLVPVRPYLSRPRLRWTDFGYASYLRDSPHGNWEYRNPPGATVNYAPPELLAAENEGKAVHVSPSYDMFSVGLIAFELLTGGKVAECALDDGRKDLDHLVSPPGYVQYEPKAYNSISVYGHKQFQAMPRLLQYLQVLGMPVDDPKSILVQNSADTGPIFYGNPYASQLEKRRNETEMRASKLRGANTLFLERALFSVRAAVSGEYAMLERRTELKGLKSALLNREKYGKSKIVACAQALLSKRGLDLDASRSEGLGLIRAMLKVLPHERISVAEALEHPWLAPLTGY